MQKNVEVIKSTQKNRVGVKETFKYISNTSSGENKNPNSKPTTRELLMKFIKEQQRLNEKFIKYMDRHQ